ncbi:hypothetical protein D3C81_144430 [compost metagenome]
MFQSPFFNQQPNQQQQFQFSPTQPDGTYYVQGAPYQVPFRNNHPDIVNGYVIKMLQDKAQMNPLRTYMYNMASSNGWQNQFFEMLVSSTVVLAEALAATPTAQQNSQEQIVLNAANEVVNCAMVTVAQQVPAVKNMMGQGVDQELNNLVQRQQQIANLIQQVAAAQQQQQHQQQFGQGSFQQAQQQWQTGGQGNWPNQSAWPNRQAAPAGNANINWGRYANTQSTIGQVNQGYQPAGSFQGRSGLSAGRNGNEQPAPAPALEPLSSTTNAFANARNRSSNDWPKANPAPAAAQPAGRGAAIVETMFDDMGAPPVETTNKQQQAFAESVRQQQAAAAAQPAAQIQPEPYVESQYEKTVSNMDAIDPERPYDRVVLDNGTEIRPAHSSGWERTWTLENPWPLSFNPNTHMKFHVRSQLADGTFLVKEVVKEIAESEAEQMEYLQNEIKGRKPYVLDPTKRAMPIDWKEVEELAKPQTVMDELDGQEHPVENPEVKIIPDEITAHSFEEAEIKYLNEVIGLGSENFEGKVREYYYRDMKPVQVDAPMIGVMVELSKKTTLIGVGKFLRDHLENDKISVRLYNLLNKDFTKLTNQTLAINLGYGPKLEIEDFVNDIEDLGDALLEDNMGLLWTILNTERADEIIKSATNILKGDEYWDYLTKLGKNMTRENKAEISSVLARYELVSVTHLPWALDVYENEAQVVKATDNKQFHAAMIGLLERTGKMETSFSRHYIVDINDRMVEVLPGYLGMNSVLVRSVAM